MMPTSSEIWKQHNQVLGYHVNTVTLIPQISSAIMAAIGIELSTTA